MHPELDYNRSASHTTSSGLQLQADQNRQVAAIRPAGASTAVPSLPGMMHWMVRLAKVVQRSLDEY